MDDFGFTGVALNSIIPSEIFSVVASFEHDAAKNTAVITVIRNRCIDKRANISIRVGQVFVSGKVTINFNLASDLKPVPAAKKISPLSFQETGLYLLS